MNKGTTALAITLAVQSLAANDLGLALHLVGYSAVAILTLASGLWYLARAKGS